MKKPRPGALLVIVAASLLATPQRAASETDCNTAYETLLKKERRKKAIECAKQKYASQAQQASADYYKALKNASTVYQHSQELDGSDGIYAAAVEAASSSYKANVEEAKALRDETLRLYTTHGVYTYGVGSAAMFPSRRVIDARLDENHITKAVEYADESVRPLLVISYFPRALTWGIGNRRWGFGPMLAYDVSNQTENLGLGFMLGVSRSGDAEGPVSFGIGVAYHLDNKARTLREDFAIDQQAPRDGTGAFLEPVFVERTGHSMIVTVTVSFWDRPGS